MFSIKEIFTFLISFVVFLPFASANTYVSPVIKSGYYFKSNMIGDYVVEVNSIASDRYETQTKRIDGNLSVETRLFGIITLEKLLNESILNGDANKASQIFPLASGKNTTFVTHGARANGSSWSRNHKWEVLKSYEKVVGQDTQLLWLIKVFAESPGFFKFEGTCEYSLKYSICIKLDGVRFIRGNEKSSGVIKNYLEKVIVDGIEAIIEKN